MECGLAALALGGGLWPWFWEQSALIRWCAQTTPAQPARAVRLSYVEGQVRLAQGSQVLAEPAVANTPLFEGMQLTTADDGQARRSSLRTAAWPGFRPTAALTLTALRGQGTGG